MLPMMPVVMPPASFGDTQALRRRLSERMSPRASPDLRPRSRRMSSMNGGIARSERAESPVDATPTRPRFRSMSTNSDSATSPSITEQWPWRGLNDISGTSPIAPLSLDSDVAPVQRVSSPATEPSSEPPQPATRSSSMGPPPLPIASANARASPADTQRASLRRPSGTFAKIGNSLFHGNRDASASSHGIRRSGSIQGLSRRLTMPAAFRRDSGSNSSKLQQRARQPPSHANPWHTYQSNNQSISSLVVHEEDDVPLSFPQNWAYGGTGDAVRSSPIPMGSSHTGRQTRTTRMAPPPLNFSMSPSAQGSFSGSNSSVTEPLATTSTRTESDDPFSK